jgi:hypothetical protein
MDLQDVKKRMERIERNILAKPIIIEAGPLVVDKHFEAGVLTGYVSLLLYQRSGINGNKCLARWPRPSYFTEILERHCVHSRFSD